MSWLRDAARLMTRWERLHDVVVMAWYRLTYCPRHGHRNKFSGGSCLNCGRPARW